MLHTLQEGVLRRTVAYSLSQAANEATSAPTHAVRNAVHHPVA